MVRCLCVCVCVCVCVCMCVCACVCVCDIGSRKVPAAESVLVWGVQSQQQGQPRDHWESPGERVPLQVPMARGRMYKPRMRLRPLTPAGRLASAQAWDVQTHLAQAAWHAKSARTEGRRVEAYSNVRAVSTETVEGTLPLKRLEPRLLCHSVPSQHNSRSCAGDKGMGSTEFPARSRPSPLPGRAR